VKRRRRNHKATRLAVLDTDPWFARLAFHVLERAGPWWVTLWLMLVLGTLVTLAVVAGPWVPGVITAVGALTAGGAAVANRIAGKPPAKPDPALDPPP
jgi:hypothetical protein